MATTLHAAVTDDVDLTANGVGDFGNLVKWRPRSVQLPPAMVGHHDRRRADVDSPLGIVNGHDAF